MDAVSAAVRFASKGIRGIPNEQLCPWDEDCWGTVWLEDGVIRLSGKQRMGVAGNLLTLGPAQTVLKGSVAKDLSVVIPVSTLERMELKRGSGRNQNVLTFRVFQSPDDGTTVAHVFVTGLLNQKNAPTADELIAGVREIVPANVLAEEGIDPAVQTHPDWYPDPSGMHQLRFWDGKTWTEHVSDSGVQGVEALG